MEFPDELPPLAGRGRSDAVARAVANMRGGGEALVGIPGTVGLAGAQAAFGAAYPGWPERFGDKLPAALRGLRVFVVKAGTGGAMFRSLQAEFLIEAGAMLGDDALADAAAVYRELSRAWVAAAEASAGEDPRRRPRGRRGARRPAPARWSARASRRWRPGPREA